MRVEFSASFKRQYQKAPLKIRQAFDRRLQLFQQNKFQPILNNHSLSGGLRGYRSINITGDWRAIFKEAENSKLAIFILLGTHSQLYRK